MEGTLLQWSVILMTISDVSPVSVFNAALGRPATQSTIKEGKIAGNAVDGGFNTYQSFCAMTEHHDLTPWWSVDLQKSRIVVSVLVTNRDDYEHRLHDFTVMIYTGLTGTLCGTYAGEVNKSATVEVKCQELIWGRQVKITKPTLAYNDILTLCEVQVMAKNGWERTSFQKQPKRQTTIPATDSITADVINCASTCNSLDECIFFNHNRITDQCDLFDVEITNETTINQAWDLFTME